jgi:hypothetical protein
VREAQARWRGGSVILEIGLVIFFLSSSFSVFIFHDFLPISSSLSILLFLLFRTGSSNGARRHGGDAASDWWQLQEVGTA